jgi:hypothetical protein
MLCQGCGYPLCPSPQLSARRKKLNSRRLMLTPHSSSDVGMQDIAVVWCGSSMQWLIYEYRKGMHTV